MPGHKFRARRAAGRQNWDELETTSLLYYCTVQHLALHPLPRVTVSPSWHVQLTGPHFPNIVDKGNKPQLRSLDKCFWISDCTEATFRETGSPAPSSKQTPIGIHPHKQREMQYHCTAHTLQRGGTCKRSDSTQAYTSQGHELAQGSFCASLNRVTTFL